MREWVVLAETDPLDGLTHSMVEHVSDFCNFSLPPGSTCEHRHYRDE
jgi:hypothetical protein